MDPTQLTAQPSNPLRKNQALAESAIAILQREQPCTLRALLYLLVSAGELPNTDGKHYKRLGRLMTLLREQGRIPRRWIVDNIRDSFKPSSWSGLASFRNSVQRAYRLDFWSRLPECPAVFIEKDATAATVQPVTHALDVSLHVCRGYASVSFA